MQNAFKQMNKEIVMLIFGHANESSRIKMSFGGDKP